MSLPQLFGRKYQNKPVSRVKATSARRDRIGEDTVEEGLYPARVSSRKGVKLVTFTLQITVVIFVLLVIASVLGIFEPIRNYLKNLQGDTGGILVSSSLVPVNVYLDGKMLGTSPYNGQSIPSGLHELKVEVVDNTNNFFSPLTIPLRINAENVSVVTVNPAPSNELGSYTVISSETRHREGDSLLIVKGFPADATVSIDGVSAGQIPVVMNDLSEGQHKVTISKKGYKDTDIDVVISSSKTITVEFNLYAYQLKLERE